MTTVILHGILAKQFDPKMQFNISRPKEIFQAIDANREGFLKAIADLAREGINYGIVVDGKDISKPEELNVVQSPHVIELAPVICGHGVVAATIGAIGVSAAAAGAAGIGITALGISAATMTSIGVMLVGMALQMALAPKPDMQQPESSVGAMQDAFSFSSRANLTEQGIPVPIGYGKLRIGSAVIQTTIKSYPQNKNYPTHKSMQLTNQQDIETEVGITKSAS